MSFNFDNDENPFNEIVKFFAEMQKSLLDAMQSGEMNPTNPNVRQYGFSIHVGPDGVPHIAPLHRSNQEVAEIENYEDPEDPFTDVFFDAENKQYQVILDMPGINNEQDVEIDIVDNQLNIFAASGEYSYEKSMTFKQKLDQSNYMLTVNNGVAELIINLKD